MTQEEKQLLLQDLSARLLYGVKCNAFLKQIDGSLKSVFGTFKGYNGWANIGNNLVDIETVRPYLRPMSSMTEEEFQELHNICPHSTFNKTNVSGWIIGIDGSDYGRISRVDEIIKLLDWLNVHHFDYRGLIEKGLALEAKKGMYN